MTFKPVKFGLKILYFGKNIRQIHGDVFYETQCTPKYLASKAHGIDPELDCNDWQGLL